MMTAVVIAWVVSVAGFTGGLAVLGSMGVALWNGAMHRWFGGRGVVKATPKDVLKWSGVLSVVGVTLWMAINI